MKERGIKITNIEKESKPKRKKCYNCKHSGEHFRILGKTHLHCGHPKYKEEDFLSGKLSPWDTLRVFWENCEDHEFKVSNTIKT